jgi:hypothetical protein
MLAAAALAVFTAAAAYADEAIVKGVVQSLDTTQIVVDGQKYPLHGPTSFERVPSGAQIDPKRITPGTTVLLELDPQGGVVAVRAMLPG